MIAQMFTMQMTQESNVLDLMCCIPVDDSFDGKERMKFAEIPVLCIYYRRPFEGTSTAIRALMEYVKEHGIEVTGPFHSIYLEAPQLGR